MILFYSHFKDNNHGSQESRTDLGTLGNWSHCVANFLEWQLLTRYYRYLCPELMCWLQFQPFALFLHLSVPEMLLSLRTNPAQSPLSTEGAQMLHSKQGQPRGLVPGAQVILQVLRQSAK